MTKKQEMTSADKLLDRVPEEEYVDEWTILIQKEKPPEDISAENSVVIFRLAQEWLAISTLIFSEASTMRPIHLIPHRSGPILLGIVNIKGQLRLCVSLHQLLEIQPQSAADKVKDKFQRLLAIRKDDQAWIFPADEVFGIFRCNTLTLQNVPVTISKSHGNYLKGVFTWEHKSVGYLDEDLLFQSLKRSVL
jgi:chemotaxis-related protein WspD